MYYLCFILYFMEGYLIMEYSVQGFLSYFYFRNGLGIWQSCLLFPYKLAHLQEKLAIFHQQLSQLQQQYRQESMNLVMNNDSDSDDDQ